MTDLEPRRLDEAFLILAPTSRDAEQTCALLRKADLVCHSCADLAEMCQRAARDTAGLLIAGEQLGGDTACLRDLLAGQEPWSDLPILVLMEERADDECTAQAFEVLGNVTLLARPLQPAVLISAVKAALRARRRQYAARGQLAERQRAVAQRDQFLAMLGHELRNPLSAIGMALDLEQTSSQQSKYRAIMRRQLGHLTRLVDDLLDVSRVTSGKVVLQREPLDLFQVVRRCLQAKDAEIKAKKLTFAYRSCCEAVMVEADPMRLEQIVNNLIGNAAKYSVSGGRIEVSTGREGDCAVLRVKDDGVGIDPEMLTRVFDLFSQAEGSLDRAKGGMGIGLTLVRDLVRLHGGEVSAESAGLGRGSVFTVRLPVCQAAPAPEEVRSSRPTKTGKIQVRGLPDVLVIEDHAESREMLALLLEERGHRVYSVADGAAGVEEALRRTPRVLLVDIGLPGLDGYAVASRVRGALGQRVYLIAVTGYGQPEDRRRALEAGFDVHLTKPVDMGMLTRLLDQPALVMGRERKGAQG